MSATVEKPVDGLSVKVDDAIAKIADQIKASPDSLKAMQFGQAAAHLAYALSMRENGKPASAGSRKKA